MKKLLIIFLITLSFIGCSQNLDDNFPNKINTKKTGRHSRIPGTKIFADVPPDYKYIDNLSRYQKDENLYFQIIESNASNIKQVKSNLTVEKIESTGASIDILKDIKLNNIEGIFGDGPSKKNNERKASLIFGDNNFVVIVTGVYPENSPQKREEILEVFKNLYYQKELDLDPFELANFDFDESITDYKYAMTISNLFLFNEDGDPKSENDFSNSINIGSMPHMSIKKSQEFIRSIIINAENSGNLIKSKNIESTQIGDYSASILDTKIEIQNKEGIIYIALLNGPESSVIFIGTAFEKMNELAKKYRETVKTIEIK